MGCLLGWVRRRPISSRRVVVRVRANEELPIIGYLVVQNVPFGQMRDRSLLIGGMRVMERHLGDVDFAAHG